MAGEIVVSAAQLRTQAEALEELNERFQGLVSDLQAEEVELSGMWEGEAKDAFRTAFSRDKDNMYRFYNAVKKYIQALRDAAAQYEGTERNNQGIASKRSY